VANGNRHVDERLLAEFDLQRDQFAALQGKPASRLRAVAK
jgi:hypothetical protein